MENLQIITDNKTPAEIKRDAKEFFLSGSIDPLLAWRNMTATQKAIEGLKKDPEVRDCALRELSKHGKEAELYGCKLEQKETGVKYDFTVCEDEAWNLAHKDKLEAEARLKAREDVLKKIKAKTSLLDEETGQLLKAPIHTSTTTLQVTFKKQ